jgi:bacterioferritin
MNARDAGLTVPGASVSQSRSTRGEAAMKGDAKVIECLNRALRHKLTAVNQCWLHFRLLEDWGSFKAARKERADSIAAMQLADKLVERMIVLDGLPNLQQLNPLKIGQTIKEVIQSDLDGEHAARAIHAQGREVCCNAADDLSRDLFDALLADGQGHVAFLETQLKLIDRIGIEAYGQLQAEAAGDAE